MLEQIHRGIMQDEMDLAAELLVWRDKAQHLLARWNMNDTYTAAGANGGEDLAAAFPHLTQSKAGNGFAAFNAVLSALGEDESGNAAFLLMLKG